MSSTHTTTMFIVILSMILISCVHPISKNTREQLAPETTFALIIKNPTAFLNHEIMLGGVIVTAEKAEEGTLIELIEWELNRWGEPLYLDDQARRFLVKSKQELNPESYEPGMLMTMAGRFLGNETRRHGEHDYSFPVFDLIEIHQWESPFRYGIHTHDDPAYPNYVDPGNNPDRHPYDPGYSIYPYTPYWYRNR